MNLSMKIVDFFKDEFQIGSVKELDRPEKLELWTNGKRFGSGSVY